MLIVMNCQQEKPTLTKKKQTLALNTRTNPLSGMYAENKHIIWLFCSSHLSAVSVHQLTYTQQSIL